ncbi:DEAD/DEAH box helicase [bacterium]|nr:DEAD/DEAH box helicase [bacterium]
MSRHFPDDFHPCITKWFLGRFGEPTEPQRLGWPLISQGRNTLILAPTGSGKTLAAFLAGINRVLCDLESGKSEQGIEILYISPLKALNYDIERNLSQPLTEIHDTARQMGHSLPEIKTAVRTGDTPANERRRMLTKPPHILITTPESLHIILTSSARKVLETVRYVIVDEIHALSPNKRGVFLSILLERLEDICRTPPVRIGLSATQKPLSEVAAFLGGFDNSGMARPVEIVDTGVSRRVDLKVVCTCNDLRQPGEGSVWPSIYRRLLDLVQFHKSTIIFANTRRIVEQLTLGINDLAGEEIVRPHHGSVSAPMRRMTETALKDGTLKGVVATGTLELGIDMGAVELVCQVESPKEVSRGLQRVGRAGHVHTAISKGRIIPKTHPDLAEAVSVAKGMLEGDVEPISVPKNCLDVLAQQIVAMAALESAIWPEIYATFRRTYSFNQLSEEMFNLTLQLVSGRYPSKAFKNLRPRVSFDRVTGRISPLPGAQRLVIANGGAIPDTGQYGVYLSEPHLKIGELDEEFVYERRVGDTFSLGTNSWRIAKIETDRVIVTHGSAYQAQTPFWRGESVPRSVRTGKMMGEMLREISEQGDKAHDWALQNLPVDMQAANNLVSFVHTQGQSGLPTDRRIVLESFSDEIGCSRLALLSVFGGKVHNALRIALSALIKRELGIDPETISGDNGVLFRLPDSDSPIPFGIFRMLTPELAYDLIMEELPNTALFGLRFRQNAARALLLPGAGHGKRTPLWLQRMKAKDLLFIAKQFDGFPIVIETFRECLRDYLGMDELREILSQVQSGEIEVNTVERQIPSPFVSSMLLNFQMIYQYEWDQPKGAHRRRHAPVERALIDELVDGRLGRDLNEKALTDLDNMLQGIGERYRARTAEELYELVRRLGDIPEESAAERSAEPEMIAELIEEGRLVRVTFTDSRRPARLVAADHLDGYLRAISGDNNALDEILDSHISSRGVIVPVDIADDYGLSADIVNRKIQTMAVSGELIEIQPASHSRKVRYVSSDHIESVYRRTLAIGRMESKPVSAQAYSEFLLRWQHMHPDHMLSGQDGTRSALRQLEGVSLPYGVWEPDILARRVKDFRVDHLDDLCMAAEFVWTGQSSDPEKAGNIAFLAREGLPALYPLVHAGSHDIEVSRDKEKVLRCLKDRGASFVIDIVAETGLDSRVVGRALWEMIWTGEVTHDSFKILRSGKPPAVSSPKPAASLSYPTDRRQYYRSRSRIAKSFGRQPASSHGRWSLLSSLVGAGQDERESLEIYARVLLERYGVVAKDIVNRPGEPDTAWGDLYQIYQRMELAGEIERGYFIDGLGGAQFGLPEAVDTLMGRSRIGQLTTTEKNAVLINACDPAYLFSSSGPFDIGFGRLARLPANYAVVLNGLPVISLEMGSKTLRIRDGLCDDDTVLAISALVHLVDSPWPVRPFRKVEISQFDNTSIIGSRVADMLESAGFEKESSRMVLWRK